MAPLYAFIQSPIDIPDVSKNANSKAGKNIRILAFDTITKKTSANIFMY